MMVSNCKDIYKQQGTPADVSRPRGSTTYSVHEARGGNEGSTSRGKGVDGKEGCGVRAEDLVIRRVKTDCLMGNMLYVGFDRFS